MQNISSTPLSKKQFSWLNNNGQNIPRKHSSPGTQQIKKYLTCQDQVTPKTQASVNKPRASENQQKYKSSEKNQESQRNWYGSFFKKDRQPFNKKQTYSPKPATATTKPVQPSQMRATLKGMVQKNGSFERSYQPGSVKETIHATDSAARKQTNHENFTLKASNIIEKENEILRQQNLMLKHELSQIKRHLMIQKPSKKQEIISNLRDTIKKEDAAIQQLKLKLDISHKRIDSLNKMMQTKDEEINMLMHKIQKMETQMQQSKEKTSQRMEVFKQKTNLVIRSFNNLEQKFQKSQLQWMIFKEKWMQEKSMYLHRINFLENYISTSH